MLGRQNSDDANVPKEITSCIEQFLAKEEDLDEITAEHTTKEPSTKIVNVFCAEANTVLLTDKGETIITGDNKYGQMGLADIDLETEEPEPQKLEFFDFLLIPRLSNAFKVTISSIACGNKHIIAINSDGKALS